MLMKKCFVSIVIVIFFTGIPAGDCSADESAHLDEITVETELSCVGDTCNTSNDDGLNITEAPSSTYLSEEETYSVVSTENQARDFKDSPCSTDSPCSSLPAECLFCKFNYTCIYGQTLNVSCVTASRCKGPREFLKEMICQYCYQSKPEDLECSSMGYCNSPANPVQRYRGNCTVKPHVLCLGQRKFYKNIPCNWTSGYKWSTALILSITLGGFGADRFYLGYWQEGIGKLFSFGGAGVWTLIDVILVAVGYLKPADGSLYI